MQGPQNPAENPKILCITLHKVGVRMPAGGEGMTSEEMKERMQAVADPELATACHQAAHAVASILLDVPFAHAEIGSGDASLGGAGKNFACRPLGDAQVPEAKADGRCCVAGEIRKAILGWGVGGRAGNRSGWKSGREHAAADLQDRRWAGGDGGVNGANRCLKPGRGWAVEVATRSGRVAGRFRASGDGSGGTVWSAGGRRQKTRRSRYRGSR